MHWILRSCALVALSVLSCALRAQAGKADADAVKVLDEWVGQYQQGQLDVSMRERLRGKAYQAKNFVSIKRGVVRADRANRLTYEGELRLLCDEVAKRNDEAAAQALLKVASVGLTGKALDMALVPSVVRAVGEEFAAKLTSGEALAVLTATARGEGGRGGARQAAALRVLAKNTQGAQRELIEQMVGHAQADVRMAAASALGIAAQPASAHVLGDRLGVEPDERVAMSLVDALTATVVAAGAKVPAGDLSAALDAGIAAYEKHGWRYQIAALDFFAAARSPRTVPILIETLARYHGKSSPPSGDRFSGMVPERAHRVLQNLTKCIFAEDRPDQWQEWWKENEATLQVAASTEPLKLERVNAGAAGTVANSFFGIPVAGSRVVFVVDISGSMMFPLVRKGATSIDDQYSSKWELARTELHTAIDKLGADSSFNVVFFSTDADPWKPKLVSASPGNKKAFFAYLDKVHPNGGTNVWAALRAALNPKSSDPTVRIAGDVDEIFLLSDGLPSVGDVVDPNHILQTVQSVNEVSRVRLNTIYIGGDEEAEARRTRGRGPQWDMDGPEFMSRLATQNHGQFLHP
ncbi:MAG: VWA domain-containing protein [Planctomycetota bacterium]